MDIDSIILKYCKELLSFDSFSGAKEDVKAYFEKMFMLYDGKLPITFFYSNATEDEKVQVVNWTLGEVMKVLAAREKTQKEKLKQLINAADFSKFGNNKQTNEKI